jgi:hypothetical protein
MNPETDKILITTGYNGISLNHKATLPTGATLDTVL